MRVVEAFDETGDSAWPEDHIDRALDKLLDGLEPCSDIFLQHVSQKPSKSIDTLIAASISA
jgi:hypothetical protein